MNTTLASLHANPHLRLQAAESLPLWTCTDRPFPLVRGQLHQWHLAGEWAEDRDWHPPLMVMAALACQVMPAAVPEGRIAWIGRRCWPTFQPLGSMGDWLGRSVFLDPPHDAERFWGIGQALRCRAFCAVVADAGGMNPTVSRRLQLAAEEGGGLALLARPAWEMAEPTYAATCWRVSASPQVEPEWHITLHRCRGQQRGTDTVRAWVGRWAYRVFRGTGTFHLSPAVGHRADGVTGGRAAPSGAAQARSRSA